MDRTLIESNFWDRVLIGLGLVRLCHYEDLERQQERLYRMYVTKRLELDRLGRILREEKRI